MQSQNQFLSRDSFDIESSPTTADRTTTLPRLPFPVDDLILNYLHTIATHMTAPALGTESATKLHSTLSPEAVVVATSVQDVLVDMLPSNSVANTEEDHQKKEMEVLRQDVLGVLGEAVRKLLDDRHPSFQRSDVSSATSSKYGRSNSTASSRTHMEVKSDLKKLASSVHHMQEKSRRKSQRRPPRQKRHGMTRESEVVLQVARHLLASVKSAAVDDVYINDLSQKFLTHTFQKDTAHCRKDFLVAELSAITTAIERGEVPRSRLVQAANVLEQQDSHNSDMIVGVVKTISVGTQAFSTEYLKLAVADLLRGMCEGGTSALANSDSDQEEVGTAGMQSAEITSSVSTTISKTDQTRGSVSDSQKNECETRCATRLTTSPSTTLSFTSAATSEASAEGDQHGGTRQTLADGHTSGHGQTSKRCDDTSGNHTLCVSGK